MLRTSLTLEGCSALRLILCYKITMKPHTQIERTIQVTIRTLDIEKMVARCNSVSASVEYVSMQSLSASSDTSKRLYRIVHALC